MNETYDEGYEGDAPDEELLARTKHAVRIGGLRRSIERAFDSADPRALRRWYVETFVLDPNNEPMLKLLGSHHTLEEMHERMDWRSTEHAAVGQRLLFTMSPERIAPMPQMLNPDQFRNENGVLDIMIHLFRPWEKVRYDPEGENWYSARSPGQWVRHGKGRPGENAVEAWIDKWLVEMNPTTNGAAAYNAFPIPEAVTSQLSPDSIEALWGATQTAFKKFMHLSTTRSRIRQAMERRSVMFLDTTTINQVKTLAPFANGAVALVERVYTDTTDRRHRIRPGDMVKLDIELMVMNANPLPWLDEEGAIPRAVDEPLTKLGDYEAYLGPIQDNLFLNCPTYWSFLTHAFPEVEERSAFLRLLGAAMFGTNLKIVAAMIGEPNAGKDTVINWLNYLMPSQVATLPFSAFTPYGDEDRSLAPLLGKRVATVSGEVGEGRGSKLLAEKIKTVSSGGGTIRVAEKYEKPTTINFDGMLFLQGNSVPQIAGGDTALYTNRLVAVEFKHAFPLQARSYEPEYLREAPYFAQILFINYLEYQAADGGMKGIAPPESWRKFAKQFADASNPHGWLEACIVPISDKEKAIPTQQFHGMLSAMVGRFGSPFPVGPHFWPKRLKAIGFKFDGPNAVRKRVMKHGGKQEYCYFLAIDADRSDGMFTQEQFSKILADAAVTA